MRKIMRHPGFFKPRLTCALIQVPVEVIREADE
jgi:hypothetical protein